MLNFGKAIRDELLWQFPLLPGAVFTYQQMCSEHQWKVTGKPRAVARTVEYLNNAQTLLYDGTVEYGIEQFIRRRSIDHLAVGRTLFTWGVDGGPLRYLDPTTVRYEPNSRKWRDSLTGDEFDAKQIVINHPIPIGTTGNFVSPLSFVMQTAQLAWLIREHDRASADGRKLRDILIVVGADLAENIGKSVEIVLKLWAGADPTSIGMPIAFVDGVLPGIKASDLVHRLGLAEIPPEMDRDAFQFQYVNEISDAIGLALRYIWNSEKATNRALEQVQQERQSEKGPAAFVRSEQRLYNRCGMITQFGEDTRVGFIEESDNTSNMTNATVLQLYSQALGAFAQVFNGKVNADAFLAWLQRDDILPADLDLITTGVMVKPEEPPTPMGGKVSQMSDDLTGQRKSYTSKILDYEEISMDLNGKIVDSRAKTFSFSTAIGAEMLAAKTENDKIAISFMDALAKVRSESLAEFKSQMTSGKINDSVAKSIFSHIDDLTADDYREIKRILGDNVA